MLSNANSGAFLQMYHLQYTMVNRTCSQLIPQCPGPFSTGARSLWWGFALIYQRMI